jgi:hypothetical protein
MGCHIPVGPLFQIPVAKRGSPRPAWDGILFVAAKRGAVNPKYTLTTSGCKYLLQNLHSRQRVSTSMGKDGLPTASPFTNSNCCVIHLPLRRKAPNGEFAQA